MYVSVYKVVLLSAVTIKSEDPMKLELLTFVSLLTWVLGNELRSSKRGLTHVSGPCNQHFNK